MLRVPDSSPISSAASKDPSTFETAALSDEDETQENALGNVELVVFDFDLTILRIHSWGERIRPENVAARNLEDDVADLAFFRDFVTRLTLANVKVAIASFGQYEVIQKYVDRVFGDGQTFFSRENISTPSQHGAKDGYCVVGGKVPQLHALTTKLLGAGKADAAQREWVAIKKRVAFLDDSVENVKGALEAGFSRSALVDSRGFTEEHWRENDGLAVKVGMVGFV
jgi:hypothetical protein